MRRSRADPYDYWPRQLQIELPRGGSGGSGQKCGKDQVERLRHERFVVVFCDEALCGQSTVGCGNTAGAVAILAYHVLGPRSL